MNLDSLNKWLTLIANLGVFAGLVFLAIELNQNNTLMMASTFQQRSNDLISISSLVIESDVLSGAMAKLGFREHLCNPENMDVDSLSKQELIVMQELLTAQLFRLQNLDLQFQHGLLPREYHRLAVIGTMKMFLPVWEKFGISERGIAQKTVGSYVGPALDGCTASDEVRFWVPSDA